MDILKFARSWAALTLLFALFPGGASAQSRSGEYEVKALFFVTLARYTQWPTNAFESEESPLVIGVLGNSPVASHLEPLVKNEQIQGRSLQVKRFGSIEEVKTCHLLFFGELGAVQHDVALLRLRQRPILTVSDRARFADEGGMIEMFVNAEKKIRLRVARKTLERARLKISPSLLKNAEVASIITVEPPETSPWISVRDEPGGLEKISGRITLLTRGIHDSSRP